MNKVCFLYLGIVSVLFSCQSSNKKDTKSIDSLMKYKTTTIGCSVDEAMDNLIALKELKLQHHLLDSITKGKGNIAFLTDSIDIDGEKYLSFSAGFNGLERFETYYNFLVNSQDCQDIRVMDIVSGTYFPLSEWREKQERTTIQDFNEAKKSFPINSKKYNWTNTAYQSVQKHFEREEEFYCGNSSFRYIPLAEIDKTTIVLVPMDCGDFDDYFSLLTIQNNRIISDVHAEGLWYEPDAKDGDEKQTSFTLTERGALVITTEMFKGNKLMKTESQKYQLMADGSLKQL